MNGPTGTRSSERSTLDSRSRQSGLRAVMIASVAVNLTTEDLEWLMEHLKYELSSRAHGLASTAD